MVMQVRLQPNQQERRTTTFVVCRRNSNYCCCSCCEAARKRQDGNVRCCGWRRSPPPPPPPGPSVAGLSCGHTSGSPLAGASQAQAVRMSPRRLEASVRPRFEAGNGYSRPLSAAPLGRPFYLLLWRTIVVFVVIDSLCPARWCALLVGGWPVGRRSWLANWRFGDDAAQPRPGTPRRKQPVPPAPASLYRCLVPKRKIEPRSIYTGETGERSSLERERDRERRRWCPVSPF